ncbi:PREDICTED: uncharacterized protein LOC108374300 [Rhagoletis zephyria]|uniref:uncharacterized protein LOC108374300 n=1 Tax=Rhagoletis zephyria TaxID=28612 RepID=UPI00081178AA|nr:PREDICTED: uncharacterized protein LOC108374300 [Rhagoletis zephyria]
MSFLDNFQYCRRTWSIVSEVEESVIEVQGEEDEVHTATPRQSRRKHDMIDDDFSFFLEETSSSLKETCDTFAAAANSITIANTNNVQNASASMFQGIAQIITAHKFNPQEEATLVGKITTYALNEIAKMRKEN